MQGAPNKWKRKVIGNKVLANVLNPLRNFVEKQLPSVNLEHFPNRPSQCVNLSIGDPTTSLAFRTHPQNLQTFCRSVGKKDGYTNMQGLEASRQALAGKFNTKAFNISKDDAYLCAGGSMAIWVTMQLLAGEGDNFLFPSPGFPLGLTIAKSMGLEPRFYHLQAHNKWSASIQEMEKLIDDRTRFILVNDPSNPLGASWSVQEKRKILELSKRKKLPILGDEIYEGMIYGEMVPTFAELVEPQDADHITIFKCSGLTKRYLGPGWRMGWILLYASESNREYYRPLLKGIFNVILMPNTVMQVSIPEVLANPNNDAKMTACMSLMKINQQTLLDGLKDEDFCTFGYSAGALYATIILDLQKLNFHNSIDFAIKLYAAENIKIFPGDFFVGKVPFIRLVISCQNSKLVSFLQRFKQFCQNNHRKVE